MSKNKGNKRKSRIWLATKCMACDSHFSDSDIQQSPDRQTNGFKVKMNECMQNYSSYSLSLFSIRQETLEFIISVDYLALQIRSTSRTVPQALPRSCQVKISPLAFQFTWKPRVPPPSDHNKGPMTDASSVNALRLK